MPLPSTFNFDEVFDADEYLYFYEDTLRAEDTPLQIAFVERELGLAKDARVLDLGCGHGRHSNELARRGYTVLGIDRVRGFLEKARDEARRDGLTVDYALGDVADLRLEAPVDHAICLFDAFGFLDDDGNRRYLEAAHDALKPGGSLLLDVRNGDWVVRNILPVTVLDKGDDMMVDRHVFDTASGRLVDRRTYVRDGAARTVTWSIRLYSLSELRALLASVGLTVERTWGGWDGTPFTLARSRMILLARRPEG